MYATIRVRRYDGRALLPGCRQPSDGPRAALVYAADDRRAGAGLVLGINVEPVDDRSLTGSCRAR
jgi:hypothetical protein